MSDRRRTPIARSSLDGVTPVERPFPFLDEGDDRRIRVLHVDDDPDFVALLSTFLEREKEALAVASETDAETALARLETEEFDCIVCDYDMPGMNGLEFLRSIRADSVATPFILYTGKGSEEIASDAIAAGVTDYMQKESGTDQYGILANRIENVVDRHRAERDLWRSFSAYRRLVEQNLVGIYVIKDEEVVFVNECIAELLGYDRADVVGMSLWNVIAEEYHETVRENVEKRQSGSVDSIEYTVGIIASDGTVVDARVHGGVVEIDGEPAVMGVLLEE